MYINLFIFYELVKCSYNKIPWRKCFDFEKTSLREMAETWSRLTEMLRKRGVKENTHIQPVSPPRNGLPRDFGWFPIN